MSTVVRVVDDSPKFDPGREPVRVFAFDLALGVSPDLVEKLLLPFGAFISADQYKLIPKGGRDDCGDELRAYFVRYREVVADRSSSIPLNDLLLFYASPEAVVIDAIREGRSIQKVMSDWCSSVEGLLALRKKNLNALLLNINVAAFNPQAFRNHVKEWMRRSDEQTGALSEGAGQQYIQAAKFVTQSKKAQKVLAKIESVEARIVPKGWYSPEVLSLLHSIWDRQEEKTSEEIDRLRGSLEKKKTELQLQAARMSFLQEALDIYFEKLSEQRNKYKRLKEFHAEKKRELENAKQHIRSLKSRSTASRLLSWRSGLLGMLKLK